MTATMLALTVGLGVWQVQRLHWKQGLLADIDRGEAGAPVPLQDNPAPFTRVVADGTFLPAVARYGAEVRSTRSGPAMGAHVLSPLQRARGVAVIVDRGWAPIEFDTTPPAGPVRIEGYVRAAEKPVRFGAVDDPVARRFYALDPEAIGAALGLDRVAPFTLVAMGPGGSLPEPAVALPRPANNHLSYAITWFGLAAALLVIFSIHVRRTLREDRPR